MYVVFVVSAPFFGLHLLSSLFSLHVVCYIHMIVHVPVYTCNTK